MKETLSHLIFYTREQPFLFRTFYRSWEGPHRNRRIVRPGDDLVIEGFPRSANSFVFAVFRITQHSNLKIANHFHTPAQFHLAVRYGVPAVLLIREPRDSILSQMIFRAAPDPRLLLRRYLRFHRSLIALAPQLIVADFETVTRDVGRVVTALNERHGAGFRPITHDEDTVARSRAWLEAHDAERARRLGREIGSQRVALPNRERAERKAALQARLDEPAVIADRDAATRCYDALRRFAI